MKLFLKYFDNGISNVDSPLDEFYEDYGFNSVEDFENFYGLNRSENDVELPF